MFLEIATQIYCKRSNGVEFGLGNLLDLLYVKIFHEFENAFKKGL